MNSGLKNRFAYDNQTFLTTLIVLVNKNKFNQIMLADEYKNKTFM